MIKDSLQNTETSEEKEKPFTWEESLAVNLPKPLLTYPTDLQRYALAADRLPASYSTRETVFLSYLFFIGRADRDLSDLAAETGFSDIEVRRARDTLLDEDDTTLLPLFNQYKVLATNTPTFSDIKALGTRQAQRLPHKKMSIAAHRYIEGLNISQIKDELGSTYNTAQSYVTRGRRVIENQLLFPSGFVRVSGAGVKYGANLSPFPVTLFMDFYYSTPAFIEQYKATKQNPVDDETLAQGYLLLSECTTYREYHDITRRHTHLVIVKNGRCYILPEALEQYRNTQKPFKRDEQLREEGYLRVSDLARNRGEYEQIIKSPYVIEKAGRLFIKKDDYETLLCNGRTPIPSE